MSLFNCMITSKTQNVCRNGLLKIKKVYITCKTNWFTVIYLCPKLHAATDVGFLSYYPLQTSFLKILRHYSDQMSFDNWIMWHKIIHFFFFCKILIISEGLAAASRVNFKRQTLYGACLCPSIHLYTCPFNAHGFSRHLLPQSYSYSFEILQNFFYT